MKETPVNSSSKQTHQEIKTCRHHPLLLILFQNEWYRIFSSSTSDFREASLCLHPKKGLTKRGKKEIKLRLETFQIKSLQNQV